MDFSALAAKETSALLTRVLATSSQASLQRVDALRAALDIAAKALEAEIANTPNVEQDVEELVKRLGKAAIADADARLKHLSAEARKITDALRTELAETTTERDALAVSLKDARTDLDSTRTLLQSEQKQAQAFRKELSEVQATNKKLESANADAVAARDKEVKAKASIEADLQALRTQLETAKKDAARAAADVEAATADKRKIEVALNAANTQAQAAEAKLSAVTTLFKTSAARVQALEHEQEQQAAMMRDLESKAAAAAAETDVSGHVAAMFDGLLGAFDALSTATTINDVLATLGEQLAAEFPRVALFRVKGNRLEGAHQIGFDLTNDIGKVMIPLAMDSLITRVVTSAQTERLSGDVDTSGLPFGGSPTFALAMPIVADGDAIAVVYADDFAEARSEAHADDELKAKFAEALRQHTVALLMRMTTELKAMAELRAYAGSLLSEIEQMYQSDVDSGTEGEDLRKRLHANLDYARSIYANRAQFESPSAAALLDAQLTAMIETQGDTPFGRDLKAVCDWPSSTARAAEAS